MIPAMAIALTIVAMWLAVGGFVLFAIAHHGGRPYTSGHLASAAIAFIVLCWPLVVWSYVSIVSREASAPAAAPVYDAEPH